MFEVQIFVITLVVCFRSGGRWRELEPRTKATGVPSKSATSEEESPGAG